MRVCVCELLLLRFRGHANSVGRVEPPQSSERAGKLGLGLHQKVALGLNDWCLRRQSLVLMYPRSLSLGALDRVLASFASSARAVLRGRKCANREKAHQEGLPVAAVTWGEIPLFT